MQEITLGHDQKNLLEALYEHDQEHPGLFIQYTNNHLPSGLASLNKAKHALSRLYHYDLAEEAEKKGVGYISCRIKEPGKIYWEQHFA